MSQKEEKKRKREKETTSHLESQVESEIDYKKKLSETIDKNFELEKQILEFKKENKQVEKKYQDIINQLNFEVVNLKKLPVQNETIMEQEKEISSLQIQVKELEIKYNERREAETQVLRDRISFYEALTQVVIVDSEKDDMIYKCQVSNDSCNLLFTFGPALDEQDNKIEYSPISFEVINKKGEMVNGFELLPPHLKQKIRFVESLAPQFLIRMHKALEAFQKK